MRYASVNTITDGRHVQIHATRKDAEQVSDIVVPLHNDASTPDEIMEYINRKTGIVAGKTSAYPFAPITHGNFTNDAQAEYVRCLKRNVGFTSFKDFWLYYENDYITVTHAVRSKVNPAERVLELVQVRHYTGANWIDTAVKIASQS